MEGETKEEEMMVYQRILRSLYNQLPPRTSFPLMNELGQELTKEFKIQIVDFLKDQKKLTLEQIEERDVFQILGFNVRIETCTIQAPPGIEEEPYDFGLFQENETGNWIFVFPTSNQEALGLENRSLILYRYHIFSPSFKPLSKHLPTDSSTKTRYFGSLVSYIGRFETLERFEGHVNLDLFFRLFSYGEGVRSELEPSQGAASFSFCEMRSSEEILKESLNPEQLEVVKNGDKQFVMVQGPPGTGKSTLIVDFISQRIEEDKKVLLCTTTNKAIDSLTQKLVKKGHAKEILAIGSRVEPFSKKFLMERQLSNSPLVRPHLELLHYLEQISSQFGNIAPQGENPSGTNEISGRGAIRVAEDLLRKLEALPVHFSLKKKKESFIGDLKKMTSIFGGNQRKKKILGEVILPQLNHFVLSSLDRAVVEEADRIFQESRFFVCTASTSFKLIKRMSRMIVDLRLSYDDSSKMALRKKGKLVYSLSLIQGNFKIDHLILDEAGAMHSLDVLGSLLSGAETLLMVGDPQQLPPMTHMAMRNPNYRYSPMEILMKKGHPCYLLREQYRMPEEVCNLVSRLFYQGALRTPQYLIERFRGKRSLFFKVVDGKETKGEYPHHKSRENLNEIPIVMETIHNILDHMGGNLEKISVLCFYAAQRERLIKQISMDPTKYRLVELGTVDSMQGKETEHVILTCARTQYIGFLADIKRINVALSRCKKTLTIIGDKKLLERHPPWELIISACVPQR